VPEKLDGFRTAAYGGDDEFSERGPAEGVVSERGATDGDQAHGPSPQRDAADGESTDRHNPEPAASERHESDGESADCYAPPCNASDGDPTSGNVADGDDSVSAAANLASLRIGPDGDVEKRKTEQCLAGTPANPATHPPLHCQCPLTEAKPP
jgi:hypothetical protein